MKFPATRSLLFPALIAAVCWSALGCDHARGRPGPGPEVIRPEELLDFAKLYKADCAGCHGDSGRNGAAISLSNPVYLALVGEDTLRDITANGVQGKLMPAFAKRAGGTLTDQQVSVLAHGIIQEWSNPALSTGHRLPPYRATLSADAAQGQKEFGTFCSRCHGVSGEGNANTNKNDASRIGSIVDESYLALVSDQSIRSIIISGLPERNMPDWRSDAAEPMTDQQITNIVAWMASRRSENPGQPYASHP